MRKGSSKKILSIFIAMAMLIKGAAKMAQWQSAQLPRKMKQVIRFWQIQRGLENA